MWFGIDATHPNIIFSTDIDNMYYVPTNAYFPPITNDADKIVGLISFDDALVIFKQKSVFALYGFDNTDYKLKEINVPIGAINRDVICRAGNYMYYLGSDGVVYSIYDVTNATDKLKANPLCDTIDLVKSPISIYPDEWTGAFACYYNGYYLLRVGNKILVYKDNAGWFLWDNIEPTCFCTYQNDLLLMNADMYLYKLPFKRFYVEQEHTVTGDEYILDLLSGESSYKIYVTATTGWFDSYDNIEVLVNNVVLDNKKVEILSRTELRLTGTEEDFTIGDIISIRYLSLLKYIDGAKPYDSYWNTHDMDMKYHSQIKQIRNTNISIIAIDYNVVNLRFDAYIDYANVDNAIVVSNGISLWGTIHFWTKI